MDSNRLYFDLVRGLSVPSQEQAEAFVDHVADAENWLKTAPFEGGAVVTVYLDPHAGARLDRDRASDHWVAAEIQSGDELLHGSELPTATYRKRFGFLQYHADLGAGTAEVDAGVLRRAHLPEPGIVEAGRLIPVPASIRTLACRPGALLHGTFRGGFDEGSRRRFRFAVERLPRLEGAPAGHPLLERIQAWTTACRAEDQTAFAAWLHSVHAEEAAALEASSRWRRYVEWRDEELCASMHRDQDARFEASGIPIEIVRLHEEARVLLRRALADMLCAVESIAGSRRA